MLNSHTKNGNHKVGSWCGRERGTLRVQGSRIQRATVRKGQNTGPTDSKNSTPNCQFESLWQVAKGSHEKTRVFFWFRG